MIPMTMSYCYNLKNIEVIQSLQGYTKNLFKTWRLILNQLRLLNWTEILLIYVGPIITHYYYNLSNIAVTLFYRFTWNISSNLANQFQATFNNPTELKMCLRIFFRRQFNYLQFDKCDEYAFLLGTQKVAKFLLLISRNLMKIWIQLLLVVYTAIH